MDTILQQIRIDKEKIECELSKDKILNNYLSKDGLKTHSPAKLLYDLNNIEKKIESLEEQYETYNLEIRGGYGNKIIYSSNKSFGETIKDIESNYGKSPSVDDSRIKKEDIYLTYVNKIESENNKSNEKEKMLNVSYYVNEIKKKVNQRVILFVMKFAYEDRFDALANMLVKNNKWEKDVV